MANCQHCGAQVPPDADRCVSCGRAVGSARGSRATDHANQAGGPVAGPDPSARNGEPSSRNGEPSTPNGEPSRHNGEPGTRYGEPSAGRGAPRQRQRGEQARTRTPPRGTAAATPQPGKSNRDPSRRTPNRQRAGAGLGVPVPTGIRIVAGLVGLLGLGQILFGITMLNLGGTATSYGAGRAGGALSLVGLLLLAVGVGAVGIAYGLWTYRPWGWTAATVLLAIGASLSALLALRAGSVGALAVALTWNLGPLWYLWSVRRSYRSLSRRHGRVADAR
jgi:hypothetical protein